MCWSCTLPNNTKFNLRSGSNVATATKIAITEADAPTTQLSVKISSLGKVFTPITKSSQPATPPNK